MTGRCRAEQVARAHEVVATFKQFGLTAISPVISEGVENKPGPLIPNSESELLGNWTRDKYLIARKAHVVLLDGADEGSIGMAREYAYNRYALWKPTIILWNEPRGFTVAAFEDDAIVYSLIDAAATIAIHFATRRQRWAWRIKMLARSLPKWIVNQLYAWR